jgi:hypothetical protein
MDVLIFYVLLLGVVYAISESWSEACDGATFLSRVITGDESWIWSYSPEKNQHCSQQKMKSKFRSTLIIFFDIKGIVQKEFVLAGQNSQFHTLL